MSFKRVPPYKVFEVLKGGARRRLDVRDIVVEVRPGVEIEINFAPHPNFAGHLVLYTPPCRRMRKVFDAGIVDDFAVFFGATNVLHVLVDRRVRAKPPAKKRRPLTKRASVKR